MNDAEKIECMDLINWLRQDELSTVTIVNDNPEFGGHNSLIIYCWDGHRQEFFGNSLVGCLRAAKVFKEELAKRAM